MKKINPNMRPSDGYKFTDSDGVVISGSSWVDLLNRVIRYRRINKRPTKGVAKEILDYACNRHPHLCSDSPREALLPGMSPYSLLKERVVLWLSRVPPRPGGTVPKEEATRRRDICRACPMNKHFLHPGECRSCNQAVGKLQERIFGFYKPTPGLNGCEVFGTDLSIAVWLPLAQSVYGATEGHPPEHCWVAH